MKLGRKALSQLRRLTLQWEPGQHALISGGTGSGKTLLARYLDQIMLHKGQRVVVFVGKIQPDETITEHYAAADGWVRWTTWPDRVPKGTKRVLFWPNVKGKTTAEALEIQRREFRHALDSVFRSKNWVLHIDEGLFMVSPSYMGLESQIGMLFQMLRSSKSTIIMLVQRPSHIPLTVYSNIDYAFVSKAPNDADLKRLAELGAGSDVRILRKLINDNGKHDFTIIRANGNGKPEVINLAN